MTEKSYLHKRDIPGVVCSYTERWQGKDLSGLYFIKCELADKKESSGLPPLILFPGGFDPKGGDYSEATIKGLLQRSRLPAVYEAHYLYQGQCGFANLPAISSDMNLILSEEGDSPFVVGLSGSSMLLAESLHLLSQQNKSLNTSGALLIGTNLPSYFNLFGRVMMTKFGGARMERRVAKHCGHPFVFDNNERGETWWKNDAMLNSALKAVSPNGQNSKFAVPVELHYFRVDTMNRCGREKLASLFNALSVDKSIPGSHRGLTEIVEVDELIIEFAKKYAPAP